MHANSFLAQESTGQDIIETPTPLRQVQHGKMAAAAFSSSLYFDRTNSLRCLVQRKGPVNDSLELACRDKPSNLLHLFPIRLDKSQMVLGPKPYAA